MHVLVTMTRGVVICCTSSFVITYKSKHVDENQVKIVEAQDNYIWACQQAMVPYYVVARPVFYGL